MRDQRAAKGSNQLFEGVKCSWSWSLSLWYYSLALVRANITRVYWLTQPFVGTNIWGMVSLWNRSCDLLTADLISNLFLVAVSSGSSCHFISFNKILACDWTTDNNSVDWFDLDQTQISFLIQSADSDATLSKHQKLVCNRSVAAFSWIWSQCTRALTFWRCQFTSLSFGSVYITGT